MALLIQSAISTGKENRHQNKRFWSFDISSSSVLFRICGLENTLIGALPRCPIAQAAALEHVETLSLGHVLFEMCAGVELDLALIPDLLPTYPHVSSLIELLSLKFDFWAVRPVSHTTDN